MRAFITVLLVSAAVIVLACGGNSEPVTAGARLYQDLGCAGCHGDDLAGTRTASPLTGLSERWQQSSLERFIRNPAGYEPVPYHLQQLRQQTPLRMPPLVAAEDAELSTLVSYLLEQ